MIFSMTLIDKKDGLCKVKFKRPYGDNYTQEFSAAALEEQLKQFKFYCEYKGYEFVFVDLTESK